MCGIYSILNYKQEKELGDVEPNYYNSFMRSKHRGPDSSTFKIVDDKVILGFHRLAINGLGEAGDQPFHSNGVYVICNGEIYNHKRLWNELLTQCAPNNPPGNHNKSDCNIILNLYLHYGDVKKICQYLRGEWAFIIYDTRNNDNILYAARDCLGKRPLYIGTDETSNIIGFASEAMSLSEYFINYKQLTPGEYFTYEFNKSESSYTNWFNYNAMIPHNMSVKTKYINGLSREEILDIIKSYVTQSVHERATMSDVPVGCYLSGGLDSSLVTALAVKSLGTDVHTFTIGLEGSVDIIAAKKVAKFLGIEKNHHVLITTMDEVIKTIPEAVRYGSTYDMTTIRCLVYQYILSSWISKNTEIKVLLTGEGADELCPGYFEFHNQFERTDKEFLELVATRMKEIHLFDGLRSDRSAAAWGLEVRMPLLDEFVIQIFHNIPVKFRRFGTNDTMEKLLLRDAFKGILPDEILYRRKHAFSDAINSATCESGKKSYQLVEEYAKNMHNSNTEIFNYHKYNTPTSFEACWYRQLFIRELYDEKSVPKFWLPNIPGQIITDPSATELPGFKQDIIKDVE